MTSVPSLNFQLNILKQISMGAEEKTEMNHKYQLLSILENEKRTVSVFWMMFVICTLSFISADELICWESKISIKIQLLKFRRKSQNPCILLKNGPQAPKWFNKILMIFLSNYKICEVLQGQWTGLCPTCFYLTAH